MSSDVEATYRVDTRKIVVEHLRLVPIFDDEVVPISVGTSLQFCAPSSLVVAANALKKKT